MIVICDRYIDSSVAYQGAGRVLDPAEVRHVSEWATEGLVPTLTVLLDLEPVAGIVTQQALRHLAAAGVADAHEEHLLAMIGHSFSRKRAWMRESPVGSTRR